MGAFRLNFLASSFLLFCIVRACGSKSCVGVSLVCFGDFLLLFSLLHCTCMREHMVSGGASRLNFLHSPFRTYASMWHFGCLFHSLFFYFSMWACVPACSCVLVCAHIHWYRFCGFVRISIDWWWLWILHACFARMHI